MTRFLLAAAAGAAFVLPGLAPAEAQSYGAQSRHTASAMTYEQCLQNARNRQVAGAVIGGVLGAVVGAEIHDDRQDRARGHDRRYDRYDRYSRHDRYGRHDRYRHGRHRQESGNDGAVVAGAGLGALAGAAVGSSAQRECARYARQDGYGYGSAPGHYGHDPYARDRYGRDAGYDPRYDRDRRYEDDYAYGRDDGYGYGRDEYGYGDDRYDERYGRSSGELLGGEDGYRSDGYGDSRVYSAGSAPVAAAPATGACRDMRSSGRLVRMCQGADGIWRPAETY